MSPRRVDKAISRLTKIVNELEKAEQDASTWVAYHKKEKDKHENAIDVWGAESTRAQRVAAKLRELLE